MYLKIKKRIEQIFKKNSANIGNEAKQFIKNHFFTLIFMKTIVPTGSSSGRSKK